MKFGEGEKKKKMKKEENGRVVLTARERALSVNALRRKIEKAGYKVSRATAWRAKRRWRLSADRATGFHTSTAAKLSFILRVESYSLSRTKLADRCEDRGCADAEALIVEPDFSLFPSKVSVLR